MGQCAFFPQVSTGNARVAIETKDPFILRIAVLTTNSASTCHLFDITGKINGLKDSVLATLSLNNGKLTWTCKVNTKGDSLFDAPADIDLSVPITVNTWSIYDVVINPLAYQQMFGWSSQTQQPEDPAKTLKRKPTLIRQLTGAAWNLHELHILPLTNKGIWLGELAILPLSTSPVRNSPNISKRPN